MNKTPDVYLVGAGPGDPELLTVKAQRILRQADVTVYDRLVSPAILELLPLGAKRIYVGKAAGRHHMTQDEINSLLVKLARKGRQVVRLKGGDPFIFGRGSEEARYLREHGFSFEAVPGITSAAGCSAYAGIPLTHRGLSSGVRIVTGHCQANQPLNLNWSSLADPDTTLVIYMGLGHLPEISQKLIAAGLPAATPAAIIERGTQPKQRRCIATLADITQRAQALHFRAPSLIVVGRVVTLAEELGCLESQISGLSRSQDAGSLCASAGSQGL
ncbi:MAG TPA: uroporphyrinogen-III C-methyltransferase [Gammaproteobacteria bacterium]|nr:uroporphyrinogen-III C-methyltransferase [Gammaproteobacteria bacterium]